MLLPYARFIMRDDFKYILDSNTINTNVIIHWKNNWGSFWGHILSIIFVDESLIVTYLYQFYINPQSLPFQNENGHVVFIWNRLYKIFKNFSRHFQIYWSDLKNSMEPYLFIIALITKSAVQLFLSKCVGRKF